jgi:ribosomal-protein-alanine N-acetyltransferase
MLRTERLLMRRWHDTDRAPFAALNADPAVTEHLLAPLSREQSDAFIDRIEAEFEEVGFGLWAVQVTEGASFIGYVGLHRVPFAAHFSPTPAGAPAVEVGWRLAHEHWGHGYATEAARAAIGFGLRSCEAGGAGLDEIVSFTSPDNRRSWRVMERVGMTRDTRDDFDHPGVPEGHRLQRHLLYRVRAAAAR